jgi:hypothetical protein
MKHTGKELLNEFTEFFTNGQTLSKCTLEEVRSIIRDLIILSVHDGADTRPLIFNDMMEVFEMSVPKEDWDAFNSCLEDDNAGEGFMNYIFGGLK